MPITGIHIDTDAFVYSLHEAINIKAAEPHVIVSKPISIIFEFIIISSQIKIL